MHKGKLVGVSKEDIDRYTLPRQPQISAWVKLPTCSRNENQTDYEQELITISPDALGGSATFARQ